MKAEYRFLLDNVIINRNIQNDIADLSLDWCEIAGQLINHRLGGFFFKNMEGQAIQIPNEIYEALKLLYAAQKTETLLKLQAALPILQRLEDEKIRYAGLKGIVFNADIYRIGDRRSNDIDLLVYEADLDLLNKILRAEGYIQSFGADGIFVEATKKQKLIQRLNYHDLVPYIKLTDWGISEIDINFLFDSKENMIDKDIFEYGTKMYECKEYSVRGLPLYTLLAHLCVHFHREATNTIWTAYNKDVTLYKVVDIMNVITFHSKELNAEVVSIVLCKLFLKSFSC